MTKKVFNDMVETFITAEKGSDFNKSAKIKNLWEKYGYFQQEPSQSWLEKANIPEMTILYLNQAYLSYKNKNKIYFL